MEVHSVEVRLPLLVYVLHSRERLNGSLTFGDSDKSYITLHMIGHDNFFGRICDPGHTMSLRWSCRKSHRKAPGPHHLQGMGVDPSTMCLLHPGIIALAL